MITEISWVKILRQRIFIWFRRAINDQERYNKNLLTGTTNKMVRSDVLINTNFPVGSCYLTCFGKMIINYALGLPLMEVESSEKKFRRTYTWITEVNTITKHWARDQFWMYWLLPKTKYQSCELCLRDWSKLFNIIPIFLSTLESELY